MLRQALPLRQVLRHRQAFHSERQWEIQLVPIVGPQCATEAADMAHSGDARAIPLVVAQGKSNGSSFGDGYGAASHWLGCHRRHECRDDWVGLVEPVNELKLRSVCGWRDL